MAQRYQFKSSTADRLRRQFSEEFKRSKVKEIEQKIVTIAQVSRQYEVREGSIAKWLVKYGSSYMKGVRLIVESESDTALIAALQAKVAELERIIGQKQVLLDFKDKVIEQAEQAYGVDIKKKYSESLCSGTGITEKP